MEALPDGVCTSNCHIGPVLWSIHLILSATMKFRLSIFVVLLSCLANASSTPGDLQTLAEQYQVSSIVLVDYVNSYNFKCPDEVTSTQLTNLLTRLNEDTELSVMLETDKMQWRDLYVEARSLIGCFSEGAISQGY
jgi:hypothetical protein